MTSSTRAALLDDGRQADLEHGAPRFVAAVAAGPLRVLHRGPGRISRDRRRGGDRPGDRQREHLLVGQPRDRRARAPRASATDLRGSPSSPGSESFGGAERRAADPAQAQRVAGEPGEYDSINVAAHRRGSRRNSSRADPRRAAVDADVRTGAQEAAQPDLRPREELGFLRTFLLIFAYVALFVGAFIIFNTFSITVAQRTREFGLLRTLGATRGQIMRSVVAEGLLLGVPARSSACSPGSALRRGSTSCSRRSAPTCPTAARCSSPAPLVVSLLRRDHRDGRRRVLPGAARHPRAADRGDARGRPDPARRPLPARRR